MRAASPTTRAIRSTSCLAPAPDNSSLPATAVIPGNCRLTLARPKTTSLTTSSSIPLARQPFTQPGGGCSTTPKVTYFARTTAAALGGRPVKGAHGKSIRAFAMAPSDHNTLVIGALDGVFRSRDGGTTWKRMTPEDPPVMENHSSMKNFVSVAVDPQDPDIVYAGTRHLAWGRPRTEDCTGAIRRRECRMIPMSSALSLTPRLRLWCMQAHAQAFTKATTPPKCFTGLRGFRAPQCAPGY